MGGYCTILGLYIFSKKLVSFVTLQYVGRESLFIMGAHTPLIWYGDTLSRFIGNKIGFENVFLLNVIEVVIVTALCLALKQIWGATINIAFSKKYNMG